MKIVDELLNGVRNVDQLGDESMMMPEVVEMKKNGVNVSGMVFDKVAMRYVKKMLKQEKDYLYFSPS